MQYEGQNKAICNIQSQFKDVCSTQGAGGGSPLFVSYNVSFVANNILDGQANLIMQLYWSM